MAANTNTCSVQDAPRIKGMNYSYYDLGQRKRGETIEVSLSAAAKVFLVDNANYSSFKSGRDFRYFGGLAKQTPVPLTVPSNGHWWA